MNNLGPHLQGACGLPAPAIRTALGEHGWGLNESGVLEKLDEDLVDELVLSDGLDHEHPLLPEEPQHHRHFHLLQERKRKKHKTLRWGACLASPLTALIQEARPCCPRAGTRESKGLSPI